MYISQIIQYTLLPVFILLAWLVIKNSLAIYEKKFSEKE
jgi:hypothetical protein